MTWLAWRQFRAQAALVAAAVLAAVAALIATRHTVAAVADPGGLSQTYQSLRLLGTALIGVPAFLGAFWGAPLVAREIEAGTFRLAWTQGVSRRRWLAVKLVVIGTTAVLLTAAFSLVLTWWSLPFDRSGNRIGTANFGQRGIVPVGYVVFALVLGVTLGIVLQRTLPAMVATLVGFFVVRFGVQLVVRPHLLGAVTARVPTALFGIGSANTVSTGAWILSSKTVDAAGRVIDDRTAERQMARACTVTRASTPRQLTACARQVGIHDLVRMQPASHFWALQTYETAIFLALAAMLGGLCFWSLRRRVT